MQILFSNRSRAIFIIFILIFVFNRQYTSPSVGETNVDQVSYSYHGWIVKSPVRSDKFPIHYFNDNSVNLSIATSWGENLHINETTPYDGNLVWLTLPQGNGTGTVEIHDGQYEYLHNIEWVTPPMKLSFPYQIEFVYQTFGYWSGSTSLEVKFLEGQIEIEYTNSQSNQNTNSPYNESFSLSVDTEDTLEEILGGVSVENASRFHSWDYTSGVGTCDGGGYYFQTNMYWDDEVISYDFLRDDDSCSGGRSVYSDILMGEIDQTLLHYTEDIIEKKFEHVTQIGSQGQSSNINITDTESKLEVQLSWPSFSIFIAIPLLGIFRRKFS